MVMLQQIFTELILVLEANELYKDLLMKLMIKD